MNEAERFLTPTRVETGGARPPARSANQLAMAVLASACIIAAANIAAVMMDRDGRAVAAALRKEHEFNLLEERETEVRCGRLMTMLATPDGSLAVFGHIMGRGERYSDTLAAVETFVGITSKQCSRHPSPFELDARRLR